MAYAIIALGGKQYRVREGERLLVDRLPEEEGATLTPRVLLVGGDGETELAPDGAAVTARVVAHVLGEKVRIGKYKRRTGYRRHTGFRAHLSQIQIEEIGARSGRQGRQTASAEPASPKPAAEKRPAGMPRGYEELTVAQIAEAAPGWRRPQLEAALAYERDHSARKGAIAAIEAALAAKEER